MATLLQDALKRVELTESVNNETRRPNLGDSVRLPKLNLPTFSGDLTDWLSFWEMFQSTVGTSKTDNVRRFQYLKGQIGGEALGLIEGFSVTGDSYEEVVTLLKNTYGDIEQLIVAHVLDLLHLREPTLKVEQLSEF